MRLSLFISIPLVAIACATPPKSAFLSPVHQDMEKVCRFTDALKAVRDAPEKLGPLLKPEIKTTEVHKVMKSLDKEGGDQLILLAKALGYEHCDLIEALKSDEMAH